jgi:hypothetical protein
MANSNIRRLTTHKQVNFDKEELLVITIFEEGIRKKDTRDRLSKQHQFLVKRRNHFKLIEEKA